MFTVNQPYLLLSLAAEDDTAYNVEVSLYDGKAIVRCDNVLVLDTFTGHQIASFVNKPNSDCIEYCSLLGLVIFGGDQCSVLVHRLMTGEQVHVLKGHTAAVWRTAVRGHM